MYDWVLKKKGLPVDDGVTRKESKDKENVVAPPKEDKKPEEERPEKQEEDPHKRPKPEAPH